jgi:phospholipid/cholesterol/gamma-HCH transport system substrate-binding protein
LSGIFKDINGLQVGNNVRFAGINVGIVDAIEQVTDSTVRVDMLIVESSRKFMKTNANALVSSDGLMGNKIVVIIPGTAGKEMVSDNAFLTTTQSVNIDEIMVKLKTTATNAADISGHFSAIMLNVHEGKGTIGKLLMDSTLGQNVAQALINIKQGAGGFKQNMDAAGHNFLLRGYIKNKEKEKEKEIEKDKAKKETKP